jgi:nucleotide-binding universal stress UspA family protein
MADSPRSIPRDIRHVLAATDFSEPAAAAVAWARNLARRHGATLHLVHAAYLFDPALPGQEASPAAGPAMPTDLVQAVLRAAAVRIDPLARELAEDGLEVTTHVDAGAPSAVILEVARHVDADLLVVATRGLTGFRRLLMGSTAERVIRESDRPVLAVHETDGAAARPVRHVLVPTDFSRDARLALEGAVRVCGLGQGSTVHLLHVFDLPPELDLYEIPALSALYQRNRDAVRAELEREMSSLAGELGDTGIEIVTEVREGRAAEEIVDRAAELGVDLVAMGTHGRSGLGRLVLGSVARRVVQHAPCPVLTVRAPD